MDCIAILHPGQLNSIWLAIPLVSSPLAASLQDEVTSIDRPGDAVPVFEFSSSFP
jgi:hypothetical protein